MVYKAGDRTWYSKRVSDLDEDTLNTTEVDDDCDSGVVINWSTG